MVSFPNKELRSIYAEWDFSKWILLKFKFEIDEDPMPQEIRKLAHSLDFQIFSFHLET